MARSFIYLFGSGGTLVLLTLLLPSSDVASVAGMVAPAIGALGVTAVLLVGFDRLPEQFFWALPSIGTVLASTVVASSGAQLFSVYSIFYFWVTLSAFSLLSFRAGLFNLVLVGVCYAAIELVGQPIGDGVLEWIMLMAGLTVAGLLLAALRVQLQGLVHQLRGREAQLSRRADQQAALAHLGRLAVAGTGVEELIDRAVLAVHEELGVELIEVLELQPGGSELTLRGGYGWGEGYLGRLRVPLDERSQARFIMDAKEPVAIRDLRRESRFTPSPLAREQRAVSGLSATIPGAREPLGVLGAYSQTENRFSEDDRVFVQAVANVLGAAIARERAELLETQLRRSQRLESVGQLAGGIAHDFNNLLAVILNYADLVADEVQDEEIRRELAEISNAAEHGADLTRQLLTFARGGIVKHEIIELGRALEGLKGLLVRTLPENIALEIDGANDAWAVELGAGQLEQALLNLAVNARDAMPDGGTLTISVRNLNVPGDGYPGGLEGKFVSLSVADTGTGMPPDVAERACDPFFTTKPPGKGTGLGLATVYGIAGQAGGDLRLSSRPGSGTVITLLLPVAVGAQAGGSDVSGPGISEAATTVLVAEEDPALLEVVQQILRSNGYTVLPAADGLEARELCASHEGPIDLLLSDVVMPGMSGVQLADEVGVLRPDMARLLVSGFAAEVVSGNGLVEGSTHALQKPFRPDELLVAVAQALAWAPNPVSRVGRDSEATSADSAKISS